MGLLWPDGFADGTAAHIVLLIRKNGEGNLPPAGNEKYFLILILFIYLFFNKLPLG